MENRLFSEGLHVLGSAPRPAQMFQYLSAYFGEDLPESVVRAVSDASDTASARAALERCWAESPGLKERNAGGDGEGERATVGEKAEEALEIR